MDNSIRVQKRYIYLSFLSFLTVLNGFFNSLAVSFGWNIYPYNTFLFDSHDLFADFIKVVVSFCTNINIQNWSNLYQSYYLYNPYGDVSALAASSLSHFHLPPLTMLLVLLFKKLLLYTSPSFLITIMFYFYFVLNVIVAKIFTRTRFDFYVITTLLIFGYPLFFALNRGNIFALINYLTLMIFLYLIYKRKYTLFAVILLSIAINIRPNNFFLILLLFDYRGSKGTKLIIYTLVFSLFIFSVSLMISNFIYDHYTFINFLQGLEIYYNQYVIGNSGLLFNNSFYGGMKILLYYFHINAFNAFLSEASTVIASVFVVLSIFSTYLYLKNKLYRFDYFFIIVSSLVLGSSVFATYHMSIFFFLFLLLFQVNFNIKESYFLKIIIPVVIFVLIPKNYIFIDNVSIENILNPLALSIAYFYMIIKTSRKTYEKN